MSQPSQSKSSSRGAPVVERAATADEQQEMDRQKVTTSLIQYIEKFRFPYIADVSNYEKLLKIGQGTFGEVFKARRKKDGRMVALKKILMENEKEGFPITALREVKMLQQLRHIHVTELIEICSSKATMYNRERATFYLVFAFCEHDLAGLLNNKKIKLNLTHCKTLMKHLLSGLHQIHHSNILHRDMKTANVLITRDGILKLADFGLARPFFKSSQHSYLYTNRVVTLWYRPPELLLGERNYGTAIDIWGAGCIMAELWTRSPILQGDTEQRQLILISQLCGSISPDVWKGVESLPLFKQTDLPVGLQRQLSTRLQAVVKDPHAIDLIDRLLTLDPALRGTAEQALDHDFFFTSPEPRDDVKDLMNTISSSMFEYTTRGGQRGGGRPPPRNNQRDSLGGQFHDMVF